MMAGMYIPIKIKDGRNELTRCYACPCRHSQSFRFSSYDYDDPEEYCKAAHRALSQKQVFQFGFRPDWCPAVFVPDHGRLIDGDRLEDQCDEPHWCVWASDISNAPTVIPASKKEEDL